MSKKKIFYLLFILTFFVPILSSIASQSIEDLAPAFDNIKIIRPDQKLNLKLRSLSGIWGGKWGGSLPSQLIVEKIESDTATVVYTWGDHPSGLFKKGRLRIEGKILISGKIEFVIGAKFTFEIDVEKDVVYGTRKQDKGISRIVMKRRICKADSDKIDSSNIQEKTRLKIIPSFANIDGQIKINKINEDGLIGTLYKPIGNRKYPGIIILHGSGGGKYSGYVKNYSAILAVHGYVTFAVSYFNDKLLPKNLTYINLEYFQQCLSWISKKEYVNAEKIAVIGFSRGGELALLLGSLFPEIKAVIGYSASGLLWGGFGKNIGKNTPAWLLRNKPLPFTPNKYWKLMKNAKDKLDFINKEDVKNAIIKVEKINGPILLISGEDDKLWKSKLLSDVSVNRLTQNNHKYDYSHLIYEDAGHNITYPNASTIRTSFYHPISKRKINMGGSPTGTAKANRDSWGKVLRFLENTFR